MLMEYLCAIVCSICVSAVMGLVPSEGEMLLTHLPTKLHIKVGETATFICNITALKHNPDDINWYRILHFKQVKIADLKSGNNDRLPITTDWKLRVATLRIINVTLNDTGNYYCGHVNISGNIIISNISKLIVERYQGTAKDVTGLNNKKKSNSQNIAIISTAVLLILLLLLITITFFLMWYKQRKKSVKTEARNLQEKPPQDPTVYTVDYGVLEFGNSQPHRKSADLCVLEQVEYATIIFPQDNSTMEDYSGRTT